MFTCRGWRHCYVILPVYYPEPGLHADVYSQVINPVTWCVHSDVIFEHPEKLCRMAIEEGATTAIKIAIDLQIKRDYVPRGLITCVSLVKALLGITAWYVWTPKHLARYLINNGGSIVRISQNGKSVRRREETQTR